EYFGVAALREKNEPPHFLHWKLAAVLSDGAEIPFERLSHCAAARDVDRRHQPGVLAAGLRLVLFFRNVEAAFAAFVSRPGHPGDQARSVDSRRGRKRERRKHQIPVLLESRPSHAVPLRGASRTFIRIARSPLDEHGATGSLAPGSS